METWLTKASRRDLEQNSLGTDDGSGNVSPSAKLPGQGSLFPPEGGENVHQKKYREKRKSRSQAEYREMLQMRETDPRGIKTELQ